LLDTPLPVTPQVSGWSLGFKSLAAKLAVSALVVTAVTVWLTRSETHGLRAVQAPVVAAAPARAVADVHAAAAQVPEPAIAPAVDAREQDIEENMLDPAQAAAGSARPASVRPRAKVVAAAGAKRGAPGEVVSGAHAASQLGGEVQPEQPASVAPPAPAPELPSAEPAPREVDLLFAARKEMRRDPSAALRFLEQHAERFPHGMLAPEREVLAIEALRKLGRGAEAERRLARFRIEYPDSLHLPALR
jgi:hypothetical protein